MSEDFANPNDLVHDVLVAVTALPGAMFERRNTGVARPLKSNRVVRFNNEGTPDIQGTYFGRSVAIEAKTGSGRLSEKQKDWRYAFLKAGGTYIVARSVEQVLRELAQVSTSP